MKIISKFQDYYDIGIAYGVDEKLRFERVTRTIDESKHYDSETAYIYYEKQCYYRIRFYHYVIGFCGRRHPLVKTKIEQIKHKAKETVYHLVQEDYFYSIDTLAQWLEQKFDTHHEFVVGTHSYNGYSEKRKLVKVKNFALNAKEFFEKKSFTQERLFEKYHIPYFVVEYDYVREDKKPYIKYQTLLLPQLKKYRFTQVMPPMQAFQEISMYLGKLDLAEDNTVTIEDKYLAQGKGFDCYSFKKMPSKRKVKSC